ncbi:MAG TPA: hypothetical protein PKC19_05620, partial [Roseiflexaceae bacterium]|nr:hypothetical protein [Roseiflexaceae bacterium]
GSISYASVKIDSRRLADGTWQLVAQGMTSGRYAVARFTIGDQPPPAGPQSGVSVRVVPNIVLVGQAFTIQGDGFRGGEKVSLWLTAPDGSVRAINTSPEADRRTGSITPANVRITTDVGFRAGTWSITAQGRESGRQAIGTFRIDVPGPTQGGGGDPARLGNLIHDRLQPSGDGSIVPLAAPPGLPFTFNANGFDPGEEIAVYVTPPGSAAQAIAASLIQRDGRGGVRVGFRPPSQIEGTWAITAEGRQTRRVVIAPFLVTRDYVAPPGTPRPATSRNATVTPAEGGQRARFVMSATGFRANEALEFWITSPDGLYVLAAETRADSRGRIGVSPTLAVTLGTQNPPGVYGYHYRGAVSGVRADIYFTYTGAP